jgi:hypothetical protein
MALIANCHRDPKRTPNPYTAADFLPKPKTKPPMIEDEKLMQTMLKAAFPSKK